MSLPKEKVAEAKKASETNPIEIYKSKLMEDYSAYYQEILKDPETYINAYKNGVRLFTDFCTVMAMEDSFVATFLSRIKKEPTYQIPTLAVSFNKKERTVEFIYNPVFFLYFYAKNSNYGKMFIYHEIMHIVHEHFTRHNVLNINENSLKSIGVDFNIMQNVAMDLAANSILKEEIFKSDFNDETAIGCFPGFTHFKKFEPHKSTEEYMIMLLKEILSEKPEESSAMKAICSNGYKDIQFDDHSGAEELSDSEKEAFRQESRDIVESAIEESERRTGNQTSSFLAYLKKILKVRIDAERALAYFIEKSINVLKKYTLKKINKKMPYVHPGHVKKRQSYLALAVDQSGSVDDQLLAKILTVCDQFSEQTIIDLIPFDCEVAVDKIKTYEKGDKVDNNRFKAGGTCFNSVTDYVNNNDKYDGLIILTDLGAPFPKSCRVDRIWVTSTQYESDQFEKNGEPVYYFK
jgi:predicted metal-dependent peptidase